MRAGHRGSVTRTLRQLEEALMSTDVNKLKQLRQSLMEKSSILAKLNEELIELVEEEQLEAEIEQADVIMDDINLAVISIDEALEIASAPIRERGHQHRVQFGSQPSLESSEEEDAMYFPTGTSDRHVTHRTFDAALSIGTTPSTRRHLNYVDHPSLM